MSLEKRKKLIDLQNESEKYLSSRRKVISEQAKIVSESIFPKCKAFLEMNGLTVVETQGTLEASYTGKVMVTIDSHDNEQGPAGFDGSFNVMYNNKKHTVRYRVCRGARINVQSMFSGSEEANLDQQLAAEATKIATLKELGTSDLDGSVQFMLVDPSVQRAPFGKPDQNVFTDLHILLAKIIN
ncbi:hypothetical protein M977_00428 [Buttiauxella gaviniae ATCC 51604]|uniref:Uncharacterized protein n=1 Tax=Buttiauxella gaviniae ATCC 51604 TaxID=1354253 RepID=A0A1B7I531_9ENTR|nr:hypothetical protein [Buttiauxella gaviniae]OAT23519.1 hypothetical protein M977_00428 [Buttiauxella gaviniae ATCC 51604]